MSEERPGPGEQLQLLTPATAARSAARAGAAAARKRSAATLAGVDPVASVWVDTGLAHLDRPFDYAVPETMARDAVVGARVKVRFAGQDLDGFVVARSGETTHDGRLAPLRKVVSAEPVLVPELLHVAQVLAARGAGTVGDVLRLAIPPRHAAAERALSIDPPTSWTGDRQVSAEPAQSAWAPYAAARAFLGHVASGGAPAASWLALPSVTDPLQDWPSALAEAAATALAGGRGTVIVVPDHRDVTRVEGALRAVLGTAAYVRLTADQGPQARWTAWLKVLRGHVRVVVGTRAAAFAPVRDLGLVAWWDDGDDLLEEPRAPYPHARDVLLARAEATGAAVLAGGLTRSVAVEQLVERGVLQPLVAGRPAVRSFAPRVRVTGDDADLERDPAAASAQLPSVAWRAAKEALATGPVLVQVPRRGYVPSMSCQSCRRPARCATCQGPVAVGRADWPAQCRWCHRPVVELDCPHCGGHGLRASVVGARRTAEQIGRAFPGVPVHTSGAGQVLAQVAGTPSLVIATPGAEPVAEGGYSATLLLDAWASLDRPTLDAEEESLRRWLTAAALTRPGDAGGRVVLVGSPSHTTISAVEALVRWDPVWFAERELSERRQLGLPPAVRSAVVLGERAAVSALLADVAVPSGVAVLGPAPDEPGAVRGSAAAGPAAYRAVFLAHEGSDALVSSLREAKAVRSARKEGGGVVVRVDPRDPGG